MTVSTHPAAKTQWPALMQRSTSALYCDMSESMFARLVAAQELPSSVLIGKTRRWRKVDLDAAIERSADAAGTSRDLDDRLAAYGAA